MQTTPLSLHDSLPLTCSRAGTCCHGNWVRLNPWELIQLAKAKNLSPEVFKNTYTKFGGSVLHFGGKINSFGKKSCNLYVEGEGCSVHASRPLACRLFPLARQIQNETVQYIFEGTNFPCLKECPKVVDLPHLSVEDYLSGQQTSAFEQAQDEYLEVMQNLADISFTLLLDTGLSESGDTQTLSTWRKLGTMDLDSLIAVIGSKWLNLLMLPAIDNIESPTVFTRTHNELLQAKAQETFESVTTLDSVRKEARLFMAMALFLAHVVGADAKALSEHWIEIAKENGALE